MKKKLAMILCTALTAASLTACGSSAQSSAQQEETAVSAETENTAQESAAEEAQSSEQAGAESSAPESDGEEQPETITITAKDAGGEDTQIEVPYDPQRIAILDMAALDILDNLGLGERVVGTANTSIDYLASYADNAEIENLGTIKEADLEAVMACEPDIIFIGGRLSSSYDALAEIAPVVYLATDSEVGLVESVNRNATTIASIFGMEDEVAEKMAGFQSRIDALAAVADGQDAVVGMCTSGSFNVLGNDGRCSIIGREIGFNNLNADMSSGRGGSGNGGSGNSGAQGDEQSGQGGSAAAGTENAADAASAQSGNGNGGGTATHGNEASFELLVEQNPAYIFVMDRDAAIGTEGAALAQDIMNNELVQETDAYQNDHIVYLEHPAVWYTAEGGITALDVMLADLESALLN
ncbi:MAG: ABC transporter substrate-binding protein [Eubacteriales bacterium]|nr:ABC transporter substrate-binding protein [Eubacteriales bacterium]